MTTARKRILDPHTNEQRSPLEMLAMLLVSGSYRVPGEGRSTKDALRAHDVAGAIGMVRNRLGKQVALAVARRGSPEESRWFIGASLTAHVMSKPSRRAALAFCRLARTRRSRLTSIGSAANASGRSTSALSTW